jgi:nucleoside-diphosphate-sugar epimerase
MGREIEISCDNERLRPGSSEVERLWSSDDKARRLVGWEPVHGGSDGFRKGIEETVEWYSDHDNLARYKPDIYNV